MSTDSSSDAVLNQILDGMKALRRENVQLASTVDAINGRVNMLAGIKQLKDEAAKEASNGAPEKAEEAKEAGSAQTVEAVSKQYEQPPSNIDDTPPRRTSVSKTSKIILTSYPGQAGVDPLPMDWGHKDPAVRGPVVVSRHPGTIRRRNGTLYSRFGRPLPLINISHRCARRFLLHLPRACRSEQRPRYHPQA
jgi:hypothetical protein